MSSSPSSSALSHLAEAKRLKAELDALRPLDPAQEARIWQKFRLDWNYHSNHIEGNSLTFGETKALLLHNITASGKPLKDHLEIHGHNEAIHAVLDFVKGGEPLTETFVRQLHQMILRERYEVAAETPDGLPTKRWIEIGQYKTAPNHVRTKTGETFHFAEPFETPAKMHALVDFVNKAMADPEVDGLALAAQVHYQFVVIHPFDDGNGRMARLLMNFILVRYGYPPAIIPTETKEDYFAALRMADGDDLPAFVEFIALRVAQSLRVMLTGARGGDIDEREDLNKQLALLKHLVYAKRETTLKSHGPTRAFRVFDSLFLPLLEEHRALASKFKDFCYIDKIEIGTVRMSMTVDPTGQAFRQIRQDIADGILAYRFGLWLSGFHALTMKTEEPFFWAIEINCDDDRRFSVGRFAHDNDARSFDYDPLPNSKDVAWLGREFARTLVAHIQSVTGTTLPT